MEKLRLWLRGLTFLSAWLTASTLRVMSAIAPYTANPFPSPALLLSIPITSGQKSSSPALDVGKMVCQKVVEVAEKKSDVTGLVFGHYQT